jgi:hypothetical protein
VTRHWTWSGENGTSSSARSPFTTGLPADVFMSSLFHGKRPPLTPEVGSVESEVGEKNVDCRRGDGGNAEAPQQPRELKANKKRIARYNSAMGSERASSVRQRYAGKICCQCSSLLPPPHRRGERLCDRCGGAGRKRVYMQFMFRKGWYCQFHEEDMKTPLPLKLTSPMIGRFGKSPNAAASH